MTKRHEYRDTVLGPDLGSASGATRRMGESGEDRLSDPMRAAAGAGLKEMKERLAQSGLRWTEPTAGRFQRRGDSEGALNSTAPDQTGPFGTSPAESARSAAKAEIMRRRDPEPARLFARVKLAADKEPLPVSHDSVRQGIGVGPPDDSLERPAVLPSGTEDSAGRAKRAPVLEQTRATPPLSGDAFNKMGKAILGDSYFERATQQRRDGAADWDPVRRALMERADAARSEDPSLRHALNQAESAPQQQSHEEENRDFQTEDASRHPSSLANLTSVLLTLGLLFLCVGLLLFHGGLDPGGWLLAKNAPVSLPIGDQVPTQGTATEVLGEVGGLALKSGPAREVIEPDRSEIPAGVPTGSHDSRSTPQGPPELASSEEHTSDRWPPSAIGFFLEPESELPPSTRALPLSEGWGWFPDQSGGAPPKIETTEAEPGDFANSEPLDPKETEAALVADPNLRREIQRKLQLAGFDPGRIDGIFGQRTRAAISSWQEHHRLPPTGFFDSDELTLLNAETNEAYGSLPIR